jgi:predicted Zn-dependent protease
MNYAQRDFIFKRAVGNYRRGQPHRAARELRLLIEDGSTDPRHLSYYGLLIAITEKKVREGSILCQQAVEEAFYDGAMYLNLATLYLRYGKREQAKTVLLKGLRMDPEDPALLREISRVNPRSTPPIRFLSRKHPLNKYLGLARSRLFRIAA